MTGLMVATSLLQAMLAEGVTDVVIVPPVLEATGGDRWDGGAGMAGSDGGWLAACGQTLALGAHRQVAVAHSFAAGGEEEARVALAVLTRIVGLTPLAAVSALIEQL